MTKEDYHAIYILTALENLINNKTKTDLGFYTLEYEMQLDSFILNQKELYSLTFLTRLRNKRTNEIIWGDIYRKPLTQNNKHITSKIEGLKELMDLLNKNIHEKLDFIFQYETFFQELYMTTSVIREYSFFKELKDEETEFTKLGGEIPKNLRYLIYYVLSEKFKSLKPKNINLYEYIKLNNN